MALILQPVIMRPMQRASNLACIQLKYVLVACHTVVKDCIRLFKMMLRKLASAQALQCSMYEKQNHTRHMDHLVSAIDV